MGSLLYTPDGRTKEVHPSNGKHWTLAELQGFVGGYIEVVRTLDGGYMVINELGKMMTPMLDLNIPATRIYQHGRHDPIVGPAVVVDTLAELEAPEDAETES
jgi:hypothetical protein